MPKSHFPYIWSQSVCIWLEALPILQKNGRYRLWSDHLEYPISIGYLLPGALQEPMPLRELLFKRSFLSLCFFCFFFFVIISWRSCLLTGTGPRCDGQLDAETGPAIIRMAMINEMIVFIVVSLYYEHINFKSVLNCTQKYVYIWSWSLNIWRQISFSGKLFLFRFLSIFWLLTGVVCVRIMRIVTVLIPSFVFTVIFFFGFHNHATLCANK